MAAPECGACSPDFTIWVDGLSQNLQAISSQLARISDAAGGQVEWAAWAQAIAATVAIGVAIWVPYKQRRDEDRRKEQDRRAQARSLAILIYPELLELDTKITTLRQRAADMFENPPAIIPSDSDVRLELTPALQNSLDRAYLLGGEASGALLQFFATASQYDRMVRRVIAQGGPMSKFLERLQHCQPHLDVAARLLKEAETEVEKIHDMKV